MNQSVKKQTFKHQWDNTKFRIAQKEQFCAIFHKPHHSGAEINVRRIEAHTGFLSSGTSISIYKPKETPKLDEMANIFDISPDGRYVAITVHDFENNVDGHDGMFCFLYDTDKREYLPQFISQNMLYKTYYGHGIDGVSGDNLIECRFLDDFRLATVSVSGEIFIWNYIKQSLIFSWIGASHFANCVAFSNKFGQFAMSEGHSDHARGGHIGKHRTKWSQIEIQANQWEKLREGRFVRLWDIYGGTVIRELASGSNITNLMFSHDDVWLAGFEPESQETSIWEVNGDKVFQLPGYPVGFLSDNVYLTIKQETTIRLWNLKLESWHNSF